MTLKARSFGPRSFRENAGLRVPTSMKSVHLSTSVLEIITNLRNSRDMAGSRMTFSDSLSPVRGISFQESSPLLCDSTKRLELSFGISDEALHMTHRRSNCILELRSLTGSESFDLAENSPSSVTKPSGFLDEIGFERSQLDEHEFSYEVTSFQTFWARCPPTYGPSRSQWEQFHCSCIPRISHQRIWPS